MTRILSSEGGSAIPTFLKSMKNILVICIAPVTILKSTIVSRKIFFRISIAGNIILLVILALYSPWTSITSVNVSSVAAGYFSNDELLSNRSTTAAIFYTGANNSVKPENKLFPCDDHTPQSYYGQRGDFWVLYNYVLPTRSFRCDQSITYTTHADWTFLDNLTPLLERWQGPLSIALYAPGADYEKTLKHILYLRECTNSTLVKELVTFHIFFDQTHLPKNVEGKPNEPAVNCSNLAEFVNYKGKVITDRTAKKLKYPVNVARNVAREMATTYFVLASDIELYPSPNLIPNFLEMISKNGSTQRKSSPRVYVLSIFEVKSSVMSLPFDKRELVQMLRNQSAIPFHKYVCIDCHKIPNADKWMEAPMDAELSVFHIGKRYTPYQFWEPFYIGTKFDPMYDERLTWEGNKDKRTQGYALCALDYEFHILNNAFLVHRPGIKRETKYTKNADVIKKQYRFINEVILPELKQIYGKRPGCFV